MSRLLLFFRILLSFTVSVSPAWGSSTCDEIHGVLDFLSPRSSSQSDGSLHPALKSLLSDLDEKSAAEILTYDIDPRSGFNSAQRHIFATEIGIRNALRSAPEGHRIGWFSSENLATETLREVRSSIDRYFSETMDMGGRNREVLRTTFLERVKSRTPGREKLILTFRHKRSIGKVFQKEAQGMITDLGQTPWVRVVLGRDTYPSGQAYHVISAFPVPGPNAP